MENQAFRGVLHMLAVMFFVSYAITLWLAHGRPLSNRYWRLKLAWSIMFAIWFAGLYTSMHNSGMVSRELLVWPLAIIELGFVVAGYGWLILTLKATFSFEFRRFAPSGD